MAGRKISITSGEMDWFPDSFGPEWDTPGLIIRMTPKDENGDWYTEVTSSATVKRSPKLKTIPPMFDGGKLIAVVAQGLPLSDSESDWMQGFLTKELNQTLMPFKCGTNPSTNILHMIPPAAAEWTENSKAVLAKIVEEGYSLEDKKYFNQPGYVPAPTDLTPDEQEIVFAGRLKVKVRLTDPANPKFHVELLDPTTSSTLYHSTALVQPPVEKN